MADVLAVALMGPCEPALSRTHVREGRAPARACRSKLREAGWERGASREEVSGRMGCRVEAVSSGLARPLVAAAVPVPILVFGPTPPFPTADISDQPPSWASSRLFLTFCLVGDLHPVLFKMMPGTHVHGGHSSHLISLHFFYPHPRVFIDLFREEREREKRQLAASRTLPDLD